MRAEEYVKLAVVATAVVFSWVRAKRLGLRDPVANATAAATTLAAGAVLWFGCESVREGFSSYNSIPADIDGGPDSLPNARPPWTGDYLRTVGGAPQEDPQIVASDQDLEVLGQNVPGAVPI
jgi:hypothetical protein